MDNYLHKNPETVSVLQAKIQANEKERKEIAGIKKAARENIFTAFSAVPALFGLMTESKGFAQEEFEAAYKLYYNTQVKPIQNKINKQLSKALGVENALVFQPLIIAWDEEK